MSNAAKHAHYLASEIGARPPTSRSEARAAEYARSVLESCGIHPEVQPFRGLRSFSHTYMPIAIGLFLSALAGTSRRRRPFVQMLLGMPALAAFWGENTSRFTPISSRVAMGSSQNIVGVLPAKKDTRRKLVLVAHIDSSRSGLMFHPALAPGFRRSVLMAVAGGIAAATSWMLPRGIRRSMSASAALVLGANIAMLTDRELRGADVPGANDNASGVGVLLALAQELSKEPLQHTEIWFAVTGCEESDLIGMRAFLERNSQDLSDAFFLGIDTVAGPGTTPRWITQSGMLESLAADYYLVRAAEDAAADHPDLQAEPGSWRNAGLDTDVAVSKGGRAMSLMALDTDGMLPNWHWPTDTTDHIDEDVLERVYRLAEGIVRRMDSLA